VSTITERKEYKLYFFVSSYFFASPDHPVPVICAMMSMAFEL